ncbi:hypothetical protein [Nocardioides dilutus]
MVKQRVYVHIGAPKTGTSYVQDRLALNTKSLSDQGVHYLSRSPIIDPTLFQFRVALDLLGQDWGGTPGHAEGAWDAFVRRARRRSGSVILSHEILAPARPAYVDKLKRDLRGAEIHVVYGARDLARQVPAAWQESIKQGRKWSYRKFLLRMQHGDLWFYRAFDLPNVLNTWGAGLPPEQVHVVTVPRRGVAERRGELLWHRFCEAFGIDPAWAPVDSERANRSLGMAETQLLRRLNRGVERTARQQGRYDDLIRDLLMEDQLGGRESGLVRLPPDLFGWAEEQSDRWIEWLEQSGVHVIGDLAELRPLAPPEGTEWVDPDKVSAKKQLDAAVAALAAMTAEAARRPDPDRAFVNKVRVGARRLRES